jgi:hypothetical protein
MKKQSFYYRVIFLNLLYRGCKFNNPSFQGLKDNVFGELSMQERH